MKKLTIIMLMVFIIALSGCGNTDFINQSENHNNGDLDIINQFVSYTNNKEIEEYISLFSSEIQAEMRSFIDAKGEEGFFRGEQRELLNVSKVNDQYIEENAWLFDDAAKFDDFDVYYVIESDTFGEATEIGHNGTQSNLYIIVVENEARRLYRVSATPEIDDKYLDEIQ